MEIDRIHLRRKDFDTNDPKYKQEGLLQQASDFFGDLGEDFGAELDVDAKNELVDIISAYMGRMAQGGI